MTGSPQAARISDEFPDELPKQHEIVCGMLVRKAVPSGVHGFLQQQLSIFLAPFSGRRNTPGGWWTGTEIEVELFSDPDAQRYLPDLVGWKIEVLPRRPLEARVRTWPQWVCEILSPSTSGRDKGPKQDTYHRAHVDHYWLVDPAKQTLTVLAWTEDGYQTILTAGTGERIRAEPFAERELDLGWLFDFE
ncbi:MAG: Uma2 family endonuclease [Proteobacteria bacterium]|nr:Uma2 family endonuclease [Pseudomonadota bacterium]